MIAFALTLVGMFTPGSVDILFPTGKEPVRLRVAVTVEGRSPELAWGQFLDKLFDHFDRDGDGVLSATEANRVFALPLPGGREAKMDFAKLDTNKDGKGTRAEFREFYRAAGFSPVVAVIRPPTPEQRRLSDALFRHLDRDGDGKLTREELEKAPGLLRRLDENEDEILTQAELLALSPNDNGVAAESGLKVTTPTGSATAVLRLDLGKHPLSTRLDSTSPKFESFEKWASFRVPGGVASVTGTAVTSNIFRTAKGFYLAQFSDALGDKVSLAKADLESDPGLLAIAGMFGGADRNGDGKLTSDELRALLDLIELGVGCQAFVSVEDRSRNLFDMIDANADGRLDLAELNRAGLVIGLAAKLPLNRDAVPHQFRFTVSRGPVSANFGPVPIPNASANKAVPPTPATRGPRWFQAMDKNGDGFVSPGEFIGTPELFRKLDLNGDGRISVEEAEAAKF